IGRAEGEPIIAGVGGVEVVTRVADAVMANVSRAIVNKDEEIRFCLVTLLCEGHLLIEDVPGVGKTMLAKALARSFDCTFRRIQFTPDLLPSDVTGVRAFNQKVSDFEFRPGPVFAQVLMKVRLGYLSEKEEANLLNQHKVESPMIELQPVVSPNELTAAQAAVRDVFVKPELREYIARLVGRTRGNPEVALGASTRGTLNLFHASQALAAVQGRSYVLPDDIKTLAEPVLAHRIILRPNAEMQGQSAGKLVAGLLEREHVPQMAYDG